MTLILFATVPLNALADAAENKTANAANTPAEIDSQLSSKPLETVLPCAPDTSAAYYVMGQAGVQSVILCDEGRYSIYSRTVSNPPAAERSKQ